MESLPGKRKRSARKFYNYFVSPGEEKSFSALTGKLSLVNQLIEVAEAKYIEKELEWNKATMEARLRKATLSLRCLFENPIEHIVKFPRLDEILLSDETSVITYKEAASFIWDGTVTENFVNIFISKLPVSDSIFIFRTHDFNDLESKKITEVGVEKLKTYDRVIIPFILPSSTLVVQINNKTETMEYFVPKLSSEIQLKMAELVRLLNTGNYNERYKKFKVKAKFSMYSLLELIHSLLNQNTIEMASLGSIKSKRKIINSLII